MCGSTWTNPTDKPTKNFGGNGGYTGTPMQFTRDSLNTGFFAMAEKLDLCDIKDVADAHGRDARRTATRSRWTTSTP